MQPRPPPAPSPVLVALIDTTGPYDESGAPTGTRAIGIVVVCAGALGLLAVSVMYMVQGNREWKRQRLAMQANLGQGARGQARRKGGRAVKPAPIRSKPSLRSLVYSDDDMQSEVLGVSSSKMSSARSAGGDEDEKKPLHNHSQKATEETDFEEEYDAEGMPISQLPEAIALARFKREALEEEERNQIARMRQASKAQTKAKGGKASRQRQR